MSREIKFRGKREDGGAWVYGDLLHCGSWCHIQNIDSPPKDTQYAGPIAIQKGSEGQFTGIIDTFGTEVYEGDFALHSGGICAKDADFKECARLYQIGWTDQSYAGIHGWDLLNNQGEIHEVYYGGFDPEHIKIIGNIHDNPELLKETS